MEADLEAWTRDVADPRVHGITGEALRDRFDRDEARVLRPLGGTPPITTGRDLIRSVGADCAVAILVRPAFKLRAIALGVMVRLPNRGAVAGRVFSAQGWDEFRAEVRPHFKSARS